jgi:hypothetical protein
MKKIYAMDKAAQSQKQVKDSFSMVNYRTEERAGSNSGLFFF